MSNKIIVFILLIVITKLILPQSKISLLDTEKVKDYLELNQEQIKTVVPMIEQIKSVIEEDKKIIAEIKERVKNGDEPGFFEKIGVKRGHDKRASQIEDLINEIENQLSDKQKNKFKSIDKPELKPLEKKEIFGK